MEHFESQFPKTGTRQFKYPNIELIKFKQVAEKQIKVELPS